MKNTSLDKLRTLASAVADAEQGSKAWDKATDALSAKFSSQCLVNLIDQLEAAQRERDELISERTGRVTEMSRVITQERNGRLAAEAELKRRNEAKPVYFVEIEGDQDINAGRIQGKERPDLGLLPDGINYLYTAAPASSPVISFYRDGIEAAANYIDQQREAFDNEHGQLDPDTGSFEFGNLAAQEHSDTLAELAEGVRSLNTNAASTAALPPDIVITAEVARVGGLILKECEGEFMDDAARRVFNAMLAAATATGGDDA